MAIRKKKDPLGLKKDIFCPNLLHCLRYRYKLGEKDVEEHDN